jgi:GNAT superfamily N-acetyltransferase
MDTMFLSLATSIEASAAGASDSRVLQLQGVTVGIVPAAADRSVANGVTYRDFDVLVDAYDQIAEAYAQAGVEAWTVWAEESDDRVAELLQEKGHRLDATPMAMALELDQLAGPPGPEPQWSGEWDLAAAGRISDRAWGDPEGLWERVHGGLPEEFGHLYLARVDGEPASFVMVHDHEGDCVFWFAATVPEARGRGLAGGLLHRALKDGRERGCVTSTTQATPMGEPLYEQLGYRGIGRLAMWERRTP